ncbi:MAG: hypothetical protein HY062_09190 [Bacteroidetes bacterium]|nr:hypothetical protein [Bacteroidota bacterium]
MGNGILYNKKMNPLNMNTMANDSNKIEELRGLINEELKECSRFLWPRVCEMQSTDKGKNKLEEMIIRYVAEEGMNIGSAIALIEQELSHIL